MSAARSEPSRRHTSEIPIGALLLEQMRCLLHSEGLKLRWVLCTLLTDISTTAGKLLQNLFERLLSNATAALPKLTSITAVAPMSFASGALLPPAPYNCF